MLGDSKLAFRAGLLSTVCFIVNVSLEVRLIASSCLNSVCKQAHRLTHPYSYTLRSATQMDLNSLCTNQFNVLFENWENHTHLYGKHSPVLINLTGL